MSHRHPVPARDHRVFTVAVNRRDHDSRAWRRDHQVRAARPTNRLRLPTMYAATIDDVREAAERIRPYAHRTPVMTCSTIDELAGRKVFFKCENFQRVGAFKFRGACNAIMKLPDHAAERGIVTHSSGNHAQAVALACKLRGVDAHIIMPRNASKVKRAAVEGYGARIYDCDPNQHARESTAAAIMEQTGSTLIPPYDHPDIIAGQGTAAMELLESQPELDAIIAPVGGGGLMSGTCVAASGLAPRVRLFGSEPTAADDAARSMDLGKRQPAVENPETIADGLLTGLGELTWPIIRDHAERIWTVDEPQIVETMRLVWSRMKIIIEPSCAVPIAAVLSDGFGTLRGIKRIGVIISGGNVDLDHLPW